MRKFSILLLDNKGQVGEDIRPWRTSRPSLLSDINAIERSPLFYLSP
jgi:hypothetical protein